MRLLTILLMSGLVGCAGAGAGSPGSSGASAKTLASGSVLPSESCATNSSNPGTGTSAASVLELLIERVPCRRSGRISYSTTDDHGDQLGVLDPIEDPSRGYLGVYHSPYGLPAGSTAAGFRVSLARSYDLIHWHRIAILDPAGATEPVLFALPRTRGYLLAYEKNDSASNHLVRIRYYSALKHLLVGRFAAQLDLPRRYVIHNNGTPDIESVAWHGSLARSVINLTFHYEAGPGRRGPDREAFGTVYGFRRWRSHTDRRVDQLLDSHGFRASHGNVHEFSFANHRGRLYEAQTRLHDFATWRVLLYDYSTRRLRPLTLTTAHRSFRTSFGEPIAEVARAPSESGRVLIVTMFVFGTGQAAREGGELVYYQPLRPHTRTPAARQHSWG